ncbi:MAG: RsmD family RNA methyltransferase [Capnocytophaga sp.]|nr:RsmD family RNA methyltransferase [Capnocytophaga sp.]
MDILDPKIQSFILANLDINISELLLKKPIFESVSNKELAQQIVGRNIARQKFPFLQFENIIFPPHLNLEQASSQQTAEFKSINLSGKRFLDLTCGLGIDAFFISRNFEEVHLVEQNTELLTLVKHNWQILGRKANFYQQNVLDFLAENQQKYDIIYIDPARRDSQNKKKFLLEDLSPNLLELQPQLWNISDKILVKLSPLIDLTYLLQTLLFVESIDIIAVKNEVKEVFVKQNKHKNGKIQCRCINLASEEPIFTFFFDEMNKKDVIFSKTKEFIYIPNNALLKSGAFNYIASHFGLEKLHPNTHLYTSDEKISNFSGRILKSEVISAKNIEKGGKYKLIAKNYPLSVEELKKKYKIKEGGDNYLIFTKSVAGKEIILGKSVLNSPSV